MLGYRAPKRQGNRAEADQKLVAYNNVRHVLRQDLVSKQRKSRISVGLPCANRTVDCCAWLLTYGRVVTFKYIPEKRAVTRP